MGAAFRVAFLIAVKDLRQRLRDRSAILVAVVAPLGLALIFSQLLGNATGFHATYAVVDMDGGTLGTVLRQDVIGSLEAGGVATIHDLPTEAAARAEVEAGTADAAFLIPPGLTSAITAGQATTLQVVGARNAGLATEIARALGRRFGDGVVAVQLSVATVASLRGAALAPEEQGRIAAAAAAAAPPAAVVDVTADLRQLSMPTYFSASMSILFLFFSAQIGLVSLFEERRRGTLARILAGPIRPWSVLLGKTLGGFLMAAAAMAILVVATTLLISAAWGPPLGVALMVLAAIIAAIGISAFVISFAGSAESAGAASSAVAITLGILGGTFSPTAQAPEVLGVLALCTPHGWFLRGLGEMQGSGGVADCLPAVGVLLAMGLVTGALGFARVRRLVAAR
ncbi:MAG: ABC transporter permease [Chloroflexota bacterium]